jgi:hypothetical protein
MKSKASFIFLAIVFIECSLRAFEGDPFGKIKIVLKKKIPLGHRETAACKFSADTAP